MKSVKASKELFDKIMKKPTSLDNQIFGIPRTKIKYTISTTYTGIDITSSIDEYFVYTLPRVTSSLDW